MSELWMTKAIERHVQLGISLETLQRSHDMLLSIVGQAWLDDEAERIKRAGAPLEAHPLYGLLTFPTETSLVQACELALYLEAFKDDPGIGTVLNDLKSHKFEAVLFELGLAYRWKLAGATVTLHPPTPKGRVADYLAVISGLPFTVEASAFPGGNEARIPFLIMRSVEAALQKAVAVNVKVRIQAYPDGNFDALLHERVRAACLAFRAQKPEAAESFVYRTEEEFGTIEVELIGPHAETNPFTLDENRRMVSTREHDWHAVIAAQAQPHPAEEPLYHIVSAPPVAPWAVIFVRFPSKERDVFRELRKKLETERKQLSGVEGPRVIALDATTLADTFQLDADQLREMLLRFMRSAPSLACVWLVMRRWQTSLRYRYEGIYIPNPDSVYQLPSWFEHGLFQNEWRLDFLTGAEFTDISPEEADRDYTRRMQ